MRHDRARYQAWHEGERRGIVRAQAIVRRRHQQETYREWYGEQRQGLIKAQALAAHIAKIDVGPRGALIHFHKDEFPDTMGLIAYVEQLKGTARLRPDNKLVIERPWNDPKARLNGLFQLTKGLSGIVRRAAKPAKTSVPA